MVQRPNDRKNEFDMFQILLAIKLNLKKISLDANVNPLKTHIFWIRLLVNICYTYNKIYTEKFDINWFFILATGQSPFHLKTIEATFIELLEPSFCRQKEFVD